jgi:hypothetical protein
MARLGDSVRKIARTKEIEDRLKRVESRLPIPAQRGIGYDNASGTNSTSGTPGETGAPSGVNSTTTTPSIVDENGNPTRTDNGTDAGENGTSPDDYTRDNVSDSEEGSSDVSDIFDNYSDAIGSKLTELTGLTDCDTGADIRLRLDGKFLPPADGTWEEGSTPPADTTFEQGYTWAIGTSFFGASPADCAQQFTAFQNKAAAGPPRISVYTVESLTSTGLAAYDFYIRNTRLDINSSTTSLAAIINGTPCSPSQFDPSCPIVAPALKVPATITGTYPNYVHNVDTIQLSVNKDTGFIERSPYDDFRREVINYPPAGSTFGTPSGDGTFCFGVGRKMGVKSNSLGGKTIYETTPHGRPIGIGRVYNKEGILVAKDTANVVLRNYKL